MTTRIRARIKEKSYKNHTEYWVQCSIRIFGLHLWWDNTTVSYYSKLEYAKEALEDLLNDSIDKIIDDKSVVSYK